MESTLEKIVKKKLSIDDYLSSIIVVILGIVLIVASTFISNFYQYWVIFVGLIIFGCWIFIRNKHIEYEYSYFDGEFQFDSVVAKRRRKKIATIRLIEIEVFGAVTKEILDKKLDRKVLASSLDANNLYYFIVNFMSKRTIFFIEPSEEMVAEVKRKIPNKIDTTKKEI